MIRLFLILMFVLGCASLTYAADQDVEINMDALRDYQPPPMFGATPLPEVSAPAQPVLTAPLPPKKAKPLPELKEQDVVQPSAADILEQIEAIEQKRRPAPPKKKAEAKKAPAQEIVRVQAESPKEGAFTEDDEYIVVPASGTFTLSLPLLPEDQDFGPLRNELQEKLIPRMLAQESSRLEIRSFAAGRQQQPGGDRRLSLVRAKQVRDFIVLQGVNPRRIDLLPLGDQTETLPKNRMDFTLRYL